MRQPCRVAIAKKLFYESLKKIKPQDVDNAAADGHKWIEHLGRKIPAAMSAVWAELRTLMSLLADFKNGSYTQIPFGSIAAVAAAVLYVVSPIDAIPDFIPFVGYLDDAAIIKLCITLIQSDLMKYREWKSKNETTMINRPALVNETFET